MSNTLAVSVYDQVVGHILQNKPITLAYDKLWVALFNERPNLLGLGGKEVSTSGTGYARQSIDRSPQGIVGPTGSPNPVYSNAVQIEFPQPTASWGTIVAIALYDAPTGGNMIWVGNGWSQEVSVVDAGPIIKAGQLKFEMAMC